MNNVLVVGGTGMMGSHVVRHLLTTTVPTRDPDSAHATELAATAPGRVQLVRADVDSLFRNVDSVFANTDFFATGSVIGEYRQGLDLLAAAERAGVERFIWSSLDSAVALTGRPDGHGRLNFTLPLGAARYPLIALDDIAWFACHLFDNWQSRVSRDLAVIGDSLTGDELAATLPEFGHDYAAMFRFFADRDLYHRDRDITLLRRLHPGLMTFEGWLHHTGWTDTR